VGACGVGGWAGGSRLAHAVLAHGLTVRAPVGVSARGAEVHDDVAGHDGPRHRRVELQRLGKAVAVADGLVVVVATDLEAVP